MADKHILPDHEKLDAYRVALEFVKEAHGIIHGIAGGTGPLKDQLLRAATSVALNIAEGAGEHSPPEKRRFYRIARRSAAEALAALDVLRVTGVVDAVQIETARAQGIRVIAMLVKHAKEKPGKGSGSGSGTRKRPW